MKSISNVSIPKGCIAVQDFRSGLAAAIDARSVLLQGCSGYPIGTFAIQRIRQAVNLNSIRELLVSIQQLRDLAYFASEVLAMIPLLKSERYQLTWTEIADYVRANAPNMGRPGITPDEAEFIAHLIISSEMPESAWKLGFTTLPSNLIVQVQRLYRTINLGITHISEDDISGMGGTYQDSEFFYDPTRDEVVPILASRPVQQMFGEFRASSATPSITPESRDEFEARISGYCRLFAIGHLRVIDHIACLLTTTEIWSTFLTPRGAPGPGGNAERARGLKLFAGYLHSLLIFPSMFIAHGYENAMTNSSGWITYLPPLPEDVKKKFTDIVDGYDCLSVKNDAAHAVDSLNPSSSSLEGTHVGAISSEIISLIGLARVVLQANRASASVTTPVNIVGLDSLRHPDYNPLLMRTPVATFDMVATVQEILFTSDVRVRTMHILANNLMPLLARYLPDNVVSRLRTIGPKVPWSILPSTTSTHPVGKGTASVYTSGQYSHNANAPKLSYDTDYDLRRNRSLTIFKASDLGGGENVPMVNLDMTREFQSAIGVSWRTLAPSFLMTGDREVNPSVMRDSFQREELLTRISGEHIELIRRTISNYYIRRIWATVISSFALMYTTDDLEATTAELISLNLVEGYGSPYGTTYVRLETFQAAPGPDDLINVAPGVFIRFLTHVLPPGLFIEPAVDFPTPFSYYYFPAIETPIRVHKWVWTDAMFNFALAPITSNQSVPSVVLDKKFAYLNNTLVIQPLLYYSMREDADTAYPISSKVKKWNYDRLVTFIEYRHFGEYGAETMALPDTSAESLNVMIDKIESVTKQVESSSITDTILHDAKKADIKIPTELASDVKVDDKKKGKDVKKEKGKSSSKDEKGMRTNEEVDSRIDEEESEDRKK